MASNPKKPWDPSSYTPDELLCFFDKFDEDLPVCAPNDVVYFQPIKRSNFFPSLTSFNDEDQYVDKDGIFPKLFKKYSKPDAKHDAKQDANIDDILHFCGSLQEHDLREIVKGKPHILLFMGSLGTFVESVCAELSRFYSEVKLLDIDYLVYLTQNRADGPECEFAEKYQDLVGHHKKTSRYIPGDLIAALIILAMKIYNYPTYIMCNYPLGEEYFCNFVDFIAPQVEVDALFMLHCNPTICIARCMFSRPAAENNYRARQLLKRYILWEIESSLEVLAYFDRKDIVVEIDASQTTKTVLMQIKYYIAALNMVAITNNSKHIIC